ncbi:hypothetical protein FB192DRAFT_1338521 [Mucor lusitanicus]|uniref:Uncharacterized protein n=2 Tax=Mucor circinelloides f. lusitanicus TaxID=29924 RepID=A0A168JSI2_MUCCL|nr:hypothetical protein FB192DRAFT_1338521 [Mucor lusitanicus]OAD01565.1 hypothetical protein MUCCIDRAFT_83306 [Mucor lusitanicus CBS 277.49]
MKDISEYPCMSDSLSFTVNVIEMNSFSNISKAKVFKTSIGAGQTELWWGGSPCSTGNPKPPGFSFRILVHYPQAKLLRDQFIKKLPTTIPWQLSLSLTCGYSGTPSRKPKKIVVLHLMTAVLVFVTVKTVLLLY